MSKKIFIKTFGCQMNEYDSNRIYDLVSSINFKKTNSKLEADCLVLNTCHIRKKATEKVYSEVGRIKKEFKKIRKKPMVIISGCVAQAESDEMIKREPYIDMVIGPQSYHKIPDLILNFKRKKEKIECTEFDTIEKFDKLENVKREENKISSYLTIQEGCDKFCNFCVVPYTRGPEYSRPIKQILDETAALIDKGVKEITLLGQNVNAYNYSKNGTNFKLSNIIKELNKINELERIRFTTSHPKDMSEDLIECFKSCKKLVPFLHLPVQSGSSKILKLMNRKHDIHYYSKIVGKIKEVNNKVLFSSDFIIGYPGESEADFYETMNLIKEVQFINSYSFIYNPRPGTTSYNMKMNDHSLNKQRLIEVQALLTEIQSKHNKSLIGEELSVLIENKLKNQNKYFGRTSFMTPVIIESDNCEIGKVKKINIKSSNSNTLFGEYVNNNIAA